MDEQQGDVWGGREADVLHAAAQEAARYLQEVTDKRVLPQTKPGAVRAALPAAPPAQPEQLETILADFRNTIVPNTTHWNHPGFLAYFAISGSAPGIVGELLSATLNINAMLWRTGPAATELEELACDWLRQMLDLPPQFAGHINDTASISSLLALAAARHRVGGASLRQTGLSGVPPMTVYCSEQAHSSIDKAALTLGLGLRHVRRIRTDERFQLDVSALQAAIAADRTDGLNPIAIVATAGTTSTTSVDPLDRIADVAGEEKLWLHVDAAYAGGAAICPEYRKLMPGLERADSIVVNPHKWLFVPVDCSVMLVRDPALLREAFSIVPDYLASDEADVTNLMDYGVQLGRRFRALKLWMVIRAFGVAGLQARIREHCRLAREFAHWVEADPRFELAAPVPFSTVCFRARLADRPEEANDVLNERILSRVNAGGAVFLSHTRLHGRYTLRVAVGNLRTGADHLCLAWEMVNAALVDELR